MELDESESCGMERGVKDLAQGWWVGGGEVGKYVGKLSGRPP